MKVLFPILFINEKNKNGREREKKNCQASPKKLGIPLNTRERAHYMCSVYQMFGILIKLALCFGSCDAKILKTLSLST